MQLERATSESWWGGWKSPRKSENQKDFDQALMDDPLDKSFIPYKDLIIWIST